MLSNDIITAAYYSEARPYCAHPAIIHKGRISQKKIDKAFDMAMDIIIQNGLVDARRTVEKYRGIYDLYFKKKERLRDAADSLGLSFNTARSIRANIVHAFKDGDIKKYIFDKN